MIGSKAPLSTRPVSAVIDRAYPVVKEVYLHLNEIEELYKTKDSWLFLYDNFDQLDEVSQAAQNLNYITEHMDELLAIDEQVAELNKTSEQIQTDLANATKLANEIPITISEGINQLEQEKNSTINLFNSYKVEVLALTDELNNINDNIIKELNIFNANLSYVRIVSNNIDSVITVANKINDISLIKGDLEGSFEIGGVIDYGNLDEPDSGTAIITGGNIYIVAQNIDAVKKVAEAIDNLPNPDTPSDVDLSNYYTKTETDEQIAQAIKDLPTGGSNNAYDIIYGESNVGAILDDLLYVAIAITSFTSNIGNQEKGSIVNNVTLSWNYNKLPETLTLNNESLDVSTKSKTLTNQNITSNKTWTLKATDSRGASSQKNVSISFLNGVYYGVGNITDSSGITNEFIQGLTKVLASSRNRTFTANAGSGQYIYYALPVSMGTPIFFVGGFEGGFDLLHTFNYTNKLGYSENYNVYKSTNSGLGTTSVEVK